MLHRPETDSFTGIIITQKNLQQLKPCHILRNPVPAAVSNGYWQTMTTTLAKDRGGKNELTKTVRSRATPFGNLRLLEPFISLSVYLT